MSVRRLSVIAAAAALVLGSGYAAANAATSDQTGTPNAATAATADLVLQGIPSGVMSVRVSQLKTTDTRHPLVAQACFEVTPGQTLDTGQQVGLSTPAEGRYVRAEWYVNSSCQSFSGHASQQNVPMSVDGPSLGLDLQATQIF